MDKAVETTNTADATNTARPTKRPHFVREIIETVVLTLLLFFVIHSAVQNFNVDGTSMEPTLHNGELILVNKWTYLFHSPARGDVIVFIAPPQPSEDYVKRIIAMPGDVISINNGVPTVNGVTLKEFYVAPGDMGSTLYDRPIHNVIVPQNDYFVMGDNRVGRSDSRPWGFVPRSNIIGQAALVYWPLGQNNDGFLPSASSVFASIPAPSHSTHSSSQSSNSSYSQIHDALPQEDILASSGLLLFAVGGYSWYDGSRKRHTYHRQEDSKTTRVRREE